MEESVKLMIRYDLSLLENKLTISNASKKGDYSKLTCDTIIGFICSCGEEFNKKFRCIVRGSGAYCSKCSEKNRRKKITDTNMIKYGCAVASQNSKVIEKTKKKCLDLYGVENPGQKVEFREKMKATMLINHGTEHALQNSKIKDKYKETLKERYGVTVPYHSEELKKKGAESCKRIYGVENPFQNEKVKEKIVQTNNIKYGVNYPSQNSDVMLKAQANAKKYKKYTMPSGLVRNVQGYEPFALNDLLEVYNENQIKTDRKDIPRIKYKFGDKERYYFPDIYIPHEKKIIEVKSSWTYKCKNDNIINKKEATESLGYLYEIWIFGANGKRILAEDIDM